MAVLIEGGSIFTDRQIAPMEWKQMLPTVFMPLLLMDEKQRLEFAEREPHLLYEEMGKACSRWSVNGYPTFFSCQYLTEEEVGRLDRFVGELRKFQTGEETAE